MKIRQDKNLAFKNQPQPILAKDVARKIKTQKAKKPLAGVSIEWPMVIPGVVSTKASVSLKRDRSTAKQLKLTIEQFNIGTHVFPPSITTKGLKSLGNKSRSFNKALEIQGFLPDHLVRKTAPARLSKTLDTPRKTRGPVAKNAEKSGNEATTIFLPESRRVFSDTSFPWCTCGRVDTPIGQSSGVMVGPRHLLTVSHAIQWNSNGTAGWIRFRPSYFNGSTPFGEAWGTRVYFKHKVTGPTIDWIEGMYDYVCVVLGTRMGNLTGWMGSRGYTDGWDGGAYWSHVGYPGDLTGGNRPTFESNISLDGSWWQFDSHESMSHRGDVWPGQSGGPFFGWWSGEGWPRVVAVQSSHNSSENNASGGQDMVDLIIRARNEYA
ncbi:MAG: serine protease [Phycisphaerae bacterium]|nr:serine protease [Phycisphaerae bacterium]